MESMQYRQNCIPNSCDVRIRFQCAVLVAQGCGGEFTKEVAVVAGEAA